MKVKQVYESTTKGGASDFAKVVEICGRLLDLLRLAEEYPHLRSLYPPELQKQFDGQT